MAVLTEHERAKLPDEVFGLPEKHAYPMPDASHARNALARVSEAEHEGHISHHDAERVRRKAYEVLGREKTLIGKDKD